MASYSFKGSISFGLVYIPVTLHSAVKSNDIGFNMLDKHTMTRIKYKKTCVDCGDREVKQEDIVKGYEYEKGKYVIFTDEDFEKIKTEKDKNITIEQFVNIEEIDPIYYDRPYYVVPTGAEKAFAVLMSAMRNARKAAIAKTVLGNRETLIAIRAQDNRMLLNTLYFHDEIQAEPAKGAKAEPTAAEMKLAETLLESMTDTFDAAKYVDEYRIKLMRAIEEKIAGKEITEPKESKHSNVIDLMEALKRSLDKEGQPAAKSARPSRRRATGDRARV